MDKRREVLEKLVDKWEALDKLEKEKMLEYVGEDINDKCDYTNGYNQAKAEIRKRINLQRGRSDGETNTNRHDSKTLWKSSRCSLYRREILFIREKRYS